MGKQCRSLTLGLTLTAAIAQYLPTRQTQQALPDLHVAGLTMTSPATLRCGTQSVSFTVTETNGSNNLNNAPSIPATCS